MGKSASCFKLLVCGGDAAEKDDFLVAEIKDSNDKSGWSFRKKSASHSVLSNTVISEAPPSVRKESSECASFNFQPLPEPNVVEKVYNANYSDEKPKLSSMESSQVPEVNAAETESKVDVKPPESAIIVIQAAIRGLLAQKDLVQLKNVVKLQAAVRGHLVRRHAVGTLRCVQAIVKMQVLVRARCAQQFHPESHSNQKYGQNDSSNNMGNQNHMTKSNARDTSIKKLLCNGFACQLLESTPKNTPIHVKCDPSKADSAWKWLERWTSVSAKYATDNRRTSSLIEQSESKDGASEFPLDTCIPSEVNLHTAHSKATVADSILPSEDEEKAINYDANNFTFQAKCATSSIVKDDLEQVPPVKTVACDAKIASTGIDHFKNEKSVSNVGPPVELKSLPQKPEIEGEKRKRSMKRYAPDQLEAEGKKSGNGSRKVSNPAFIAAQSKFEELSSMENSGRTSSLSYQDAAAESPLDTPSVGTDTAYRSKELSENSTPYLSRIGGYECITELCNSSTLDSPDISEVGAIENKQNSKIVERVGNFENTTDQDVEANIPASNLATSVMDQSEVVDEIRGSMVPSLVAADSEKPVMTEKSVSDLPRGQVENAPQASRLSPESSPRSHVTVPEAQGAPSTELSMKPKDNNIDKIGSSTKRGTLPVSNKSPVNANNNSGSKSSRERLSKDQQNRKRWNSFGSVKPDQIDQESRDNTSNNNHVPHFMQATESARAKSNANNSPRSSPDVHERDLQVKKRHSLPGATGRQVSPRIQHSVSQAQQSAKGNGVHPPPQERKWLR